MVNSICMRSSSMVICRESHSTRGICNMVNHSMGHRCSMFVLVRNTSHMVKEHILVRTGKICCNMNMDISCRMGSHSVCCCNSMDNHSICCSMDKGYYHVCSRDKLSMNRSGG